MNKIMEKYGTDAILYFEGHATTFISKLAEHHFGGASSGVRTPLKEIWTIINIIIYDMI